MRTTLFALLAALSLGAAALHDRAAAEPPGWMQSPQEIAALVEGRTHHRDRADGTQETEFHTRDGRVAYLFQGCTVSGRWWLEENVLCYAYPSVTGDMKHCFWLRQTRGQLEYWSVSEPQAQTPTAVTIDNLTGNSDNLALGADGPCEAI